MSRLAAAFLPYLSPGAGEVGSGSQAELEDALAALLERARAALPDSKVTDEVFLGFVAQRVAGPLGAMPVDELLLTCACAHGEEAALRIVERRYWPRLAAAIARVDPAPVFADEVRQALREKLFVARPGALPRIAEFAGQGPLVSWLRAAAVRTALNLKRPGRREDPAEEDALEALPLAGPDPELALLRERHRPAFKAAFRAALAGLSARERTVLKLQAIDGLSLERIGAIYGVNKSTVSRWQARSLDLLVDSTRRCLREQLALDTTELESLMRALRSGLEISVAALLEE